MMKKKVLSLAFAAISLVAFNGMAQTNNDNTSNVSNKECVNKNTCVNGNTCANGNVCVNGNTCANGKKACPNVGKARKAGKHAKANPFEGINLTEAQKSRLQQLDTKRKAARQEQAQAKKDMKQRNDSARKADRIASKKAYLEEIKAIVGPENYVIFLENMYVNGGNGHGNKAALSQRHGDKSKGMKKGNGDRRGKNGKQHAAVKNTEKAKANS